jgi:hypothetical protein
MKECIGPAPIGEDDLFAVIDGEAAPGVYEHVAACGLCQARLEQVRGFHTGLMDTLGWGVGVTEAFEAAIAPWFRDRPPPMVEPAPSLWERAAAVVRQLIPQPMVTVQGLKGSDDGTVQRLSARVDALTLVLEAHPTDSAGVVRLKGMILDEADLESEDDDAPFRWAGSLVEVGQGRVPSHITLMDEQAEFTVNPLPVGSWDMQITAGWGEVLQLQGVVFT